MAKSNILKRCEIIVFIIYVLRISVLHDSCRMTQIYSIIIIIIIIIQLYIRPQWVHTKYNTNIKR